MSLSPACWGRAPRGFGGTCNSLNGPSLELPSILKFKFWFKSEFLNEILKTGSSYPSHFGGTDSLGPPSHPSLGHQFLGVWCLHQLSIFLCPNQPNNTFLSFFHKNMTPDPIFTQNKSLLRIHLWQYCWVQGKLGFGKNKRDLSQGFG